MQFDAKAIQRFSQTGRVLAYLAVALYMVDVVAPFFFPVELAVYNLDGGIWTGTADDLAGADRFLVGVLIGVPQLFWAWGILHLAWLFSRFCSGQVFFDETFRHLQWFGGMMLATAILQPPCFIFAQAVLTSGVFGEAVVSVESDDILDTLDLLIAGCLVYALASVFRHAVQLSEEQALTV